ncbi:DUF397 domain-containing protein [Streptomyces sp. NBC_00988]|uniref:DUF397 domain-containing protein n=1 Tax=Streptomyces sp. NBC_00988 TaxID=2903704 RepID=UPI003862EAE3|nr:DUF397 domain-containing protein [Streptomyces sp. NBC_00988]
MTQAAQWQKSSFSEGGDGNTCVELAATSPATLHLRESQTPSTELTTTTAPLAHLIRNLKSAHPTTSP